MMQRINTVFVFLSGIIFALLSGCDQNSTPPVTIAVNPWPGYAFLHLAEEKNFFEAHDLNIKVVPVDSLSDAQRAYVHGRVDGMASTVVESVHAHYSAGRPLSVILVSDYSNGGDVILTNDSIDSVAELKSKRVGCEVGSLGVFMLQRALAQQRFKLVRC